MFIYLILCVFSFSTFAAPVASYLVTDSSYEDVNFSIKIEADFSSKPIQTKTSMPLSLVRGGPGSSLRIGSTLFQTMYTTFGASNQSIFVSENQSVVGLYGSNNRKCCKENLRYIKEFNQLLFKSSGKLLRMQLKPETNHPIPDVLVSDEDVLFYRFDVMNYDGRYYIVGIREREGIVYVYEVNKDKATFLFSKVVDTEKLIKVQALTDNKFLIQTQGLLLKFAIDFEKRDLVLEKKIVFSSDWVIKPIPNTQTFLTYSDALYSGLNVFDYDLDVLASFNATIGPDFTEVAEFFDERHFVMPVYSTLTERYRLYFFEIDLEGRKIKKIHESPFPYDPPGFISVLTSSFE